MKTWEWTTQYTISAVPHEIQGAISFFIEVEWCCGNPAGREWAVRHNGYCLGIDGEWEYEPIPSSRTDSWLKEHRFGVLDALRLAKEEASKITVNGVTASQYVKRHYDALEIVEA